MNDDVAALFLDNSILELAGAVRTLTRCLERLTEEQVWSRGGAHENAVGNLLLHLSGNMRQWLIHGVGGRPDVRTRDAEFAATGGYTRAELLALFQSTVDEASPILRTVSAPHLFEIINPQHGPVTVLYAIYHVVTHVHTHTGQVVLLTKQMAGTDLDLTIPRPR
ncbi:MAG: DUF1572 domain-containing protein [Acidobacteriota bacterium]|nr:DUF1572 domain-containing protein [Acidobacteriota bacterium]